MNKFDIEQTLIQMPVNIKKQAIYVMDMANEVEKLRAKIADHKLTAQQVIANDMKYTNDKARKELKLKSEQIELDCLCDTFRAYLAIAGMTGEK